MMYIGALTNEAAERIGLTVGTHRTVILRDGGDGQEAIAWTDGEIDPPARVTHDDLEGIPVPVWTALRALERTV